MGKKRKQERKAVLTSLRVKQKEELFKVDESTICIDCLDYIRGPKFSVGVIGGKLTYICSSCASESGEDSTDEYDDISLDDDEGDEDDDDNY